MLCVLATAKLWRRSGGLVRKHVCGSDAAVKKMGGKKTVAFVDVAKKLKKKQQQTRDIGKEKGKCSCVRS